MCIRSVSIDEVRLRRINPSFNDEAVIDRWLQDVIANAIEDLELPHRPSPNAHGAEEMHALLVDRVRRAEAGEERMVPHQVVFDSIREKYGF